MKPSIIMLSIHPLGDNRISKYQSVLSDAHYDVFNIHFLSERVQNTNLESVIQIPVNRIGKRFYFLLCKRLILEKIIRLVYSPSKSIIIIHDPILLPLSKIIKRKMGWKIIYDRHEYYEELKKMRFFSEGLLYEKRYLKYADVLICINEQHAEKTKVLFKTVFHNQIIVIHNYPSLKKQIDADVLKCLKPKIPTISYIGSMNWNADRDIGLMLQCVEAIERLNIDYHCVFAGKVYDSILLDRLSALQIKTHNRFEYLGVIDREKAIAITTQSHIGFLFLNNTYFVPCSPNKVFEYLYYGVIPFARLNCSDDLSKYTRYMYDITIAPSVIINDFVTLVSNMNLITQMIDNILQKGCPFLWENDIQQLFVYLQ